MGITQREYPCPTENFTTLEPRNQSNDVSKLNKNRLPPDFEPTELGNVRSGWDSRLDYNLNGEVSEEMSSLFDEMHFF